MTSVTKYFCHLVDQDVYKAKHLCTSMFVEILLSDMFRHLALMVHQTNINVYTKSGTLKRHTFQSFVWIQNGLKFFVFYMAHLKLIILLISTVLSLLLKYRNSTSYPLMLNNFKIFFAFESYWDHVHILKIQLPIGHPETYLRIYKMKILLLLKQIWS